MKLTIEIGNINEMQQLLQLFKAMNLESIKVVMDKQNVPALPLLAQLRRPIQPFLNIEAIKQAKNYQGLNRKRFDSLIQEINIGEPIEVLLGQLSQ